MKASGNESPTPTHKYNLWTKCALFEESSDIFFVYLFIHSLKAGQLIALASEKRAILHEEAGC